MKDLARASLVCLPTGGDHETIKLLQKFGKLTGNKVSVPANRFIDRRSIVPIPKLVKLSLRNLTFTPWNSVVSILLRLLAPGDLHITSTHNKGPDWPWEIYF